MSSDASPSLAVPRRAVIRGWLPWLCTVAPAAPLLAHPGHAVYTLATPEQPMHWLIEPAHALTWSTLALAACTVHHLWQTRRLRNARGASTPTHVA